MSNTWITSDTHLGHFNIIRYCNRPFSSAEEMDETIIKNWNAVVGTDDIVYHLGDFSLSNGTKCREYIKRLNGRIHILFGSHDKEAFQNKDLFFKWWYKNTIVEINYKCIPIILSHCAPLTWERRSHGAIALFGHSHSSSSKPMICQQGSYDVGQDNTGFTPISMDEAIRKAKDPKGKLTVMDIYDQSPKIQDPSQSGDLSYIDKSIIPQEIQNQKRRDSNIFDGMQKACPEMEIRNIVFDHIKDNHEIWAEIIEDPKVVGVRDVEIRIFSTELGDDREYLIEVLESIRKSLQDKEYFVTRNVYEDNKKNIVFIRCSSEPMAECPRGLLKAEKNIFGEFGERYNMIKKDVIKMNRLNNLKNPTAVATLSAYGVELDLVFEQISKNKVRIRLPENLFNPHLRGEIVLQLKKWDNDVTLSVDSCGDNYEYVILEKEK